MIHAEQTAKISEEWQGFIKLCHGKILTAAMNGLRVCVVGNDFDLNKHDYGPIMQAYYAGNVKDPDNPDRAINIYILFLESYGYAVEWQQSCITIKW